MGIESVFPQTVFEIGSIRITSTVVTTWVVVAVLCLLALWAHGRFRVWEPETWQLSIEYIVEYVESLITDTVGHVLPQTVPYVTTMISFIAMANLLGMLPGFGSIGLWRMQNGVRVFVPLFQTPTSDLNTTVALSLVSLASTYYYGAQQRGIKAQLLSLFEPMVLMLPLNVIGQLSRLLSMALRLFGNVIAGEIISATMFMLVPVLAPLPLNALSMITGVLQALVFTVLTVAFVADAMQLEPND